MRRSTLRSVAAIGIGIALAACGSDESNGPGGITGPTGQNPQPDPNAPATQTPEEEIRKILDARKVDYGEALRTASLKLVGELPTLTEIQSIANAASDNDKKVAYEGHIDRMLGDPRFTERMIAYWKDTFRMGQVGQVQQNQPNKDFAPNFAAMNVVQDGDYRQLFTATTGTCPTYDAQTNTFTPGNCAGTQPTAGIITDPGLMAHYFANMAFRRVRFVQETFACSKFPAEYSDTPQPMGAGTYTGKFAFESIVGKKNTPNAKIDFHDTQAVICANCHANLNHVAPLFIFFRENGTYDTNPANVDVRVPIQGTPRATPADYLPAGEALAWRFGKGITDLPSLGQALATDPEVARCAVNRVWNYAMSRGDIVADQSPVPNAVTDPFMADFNANYKLKEVFRKVFKAEDFVKF
ncbi:MAG: DUF1549 domain-containing protein [Myxococcales bacterium]|nr:DUF1549 domain-containing protein [Myxococcales bacterium]